MSLEFILNENVLIPRRDTEVLVETVIECVRDKPVNIIEIGTGSGCISISIAAYCKNARITASDISSGAIGLAKINAENNAVSDRINFLTCDLFGNIDNKADIIVSNPPYIKTAEISMLPENVRNYEPLTALDGGLDGLGFYREITQQSKNYLLPNGLLFFEIGYDQGHSVCNIMAESGYNNINCKKDLAGLDRVVYGCLG